MSLIKMIKAQLGLSVTSANNFTLDASADNGTMKLARGNAGATTQDIMTVDAAGKVAFPQNVIPAFRGYVAGASHPDASAINPAIGQDYDLGGDFFTPGVSKYQPTIAGYYQFNAYIDFAGLPINGYVLITKNGASVGGNQGNNYKMQGSALVYLNGTTDYVQLVTYQFSGAPMYCSIEFTGFMARPA